MQNRKYKLIGFSRHPEHVANVMVLATGKQLSIPLTEIFNSTVAEDLSPIETKEICRKLYSAEGFQGAYDIQDRKESYWITFAVIATILSAVFILSNITGVKPIEIANSGFIVPFAIFLYPISFILVDILNEFYGLRMARAAILLSTVTNAFLLLMLNLSGYAPTISDWQAVNESYQSIIHSINSVFLASMIAYFVSENVNAYLLQKIKQLTNGRRLVVRVFFSTFFASLIDSAIFIYLAFSHILSPTVLWSMFICQVVVKSIYAIVGVGPIYGARALFNKYINR
ncbi:queuosine precursor transporter [Vibrio gazogenes]|uniref:Probable queuosine precursor transporter n=1 Tax=Vibrio gazogenes TaxID=687 RepID=A0A1Z2SF41_VIBGA|nr:queuosine precursor transporter [Vibrio gazogenes]ASA55727.1 precorrin-3B C(17)-methyltransferase [Vibrio gazogenes]